MSSYAQVDWGSGGRKRQHSRAVGNAKAAGPSEFGRLKGSMIGPAYEVRSSCITAYKERNPQQQVVWCNNIIARARAMGIIKSEDPFAEAKRLRAEADKASGAVRADFLRRAEKIESVPDGGMSLDNCLAFAALAARLPEAHLLDFALAHKGAKFATSCYTEAAKPKWNVVRWATEEENAAMVTIGESLASGAALPGLLGKVQAELAAATASSRPVRAPKVEAVKAPRPPTERELHQAAGAKLSLESKLRWTRRIFSHLHPNWTNRWWGQGDYSAREAAEEHFRDLAKEARDDAVFARTTPIRLWLGACTDVAPSWAECEQRRLAKRAAREEAEVALRSAECAEALAKRFPTFVAILHWGRGTLEHPSVTARKAAAKKVHQKQRRLNGKERAAAERAALAAIRALPDHIVATDASAYSRPMEQIRSISFKNLPLAETLPEQAQLREALSQLVKRAGAEVAKVRGALFVPTQGRGGPTKGFGFVECSTAAGAQRVIAAVGARGTLDLEFNGMTSQVFVELAASNRQTKEQMEAKKAKDAAERAASQAECRRLVLATLRPATKVELAEETPSPATAAAAVPVLAKVCLGATAKARREAEAAAEAARLKAEVEAMFSAPLGGVVRTAPKAPKFKQSFAASAKIGATAAKMEVMDEFTIRVDGRVLAVVAAPSTELGAAQSTMRKIMAESAAKAKKAKRDALYAQWLKDKAAADADPMGWDIGEWVEPE